MEPARGALDVVTTDTLVEGVHFDRSFVSAADVGHKTLAINLSDLAAMGAAPRVAVLALVLPDAVSVLDLDAVIEGLLTLAARHGIALVGGNVTRTHGPLVLGLTAVGAVRRRRVVTRDGGRPGDELWVTGSVGAAAAGLDALRRGRPADPASDPDLDDCVHRYRRPEPRVRIGALLGRNRVARAGVDLSDGLADGLRQLTRASGVGAVVDSAAIPVHPGARRWFVRRGDDPVEAALRGGGRLRTADRGSPPQSPRAPDPGAPVPGGPDHAYRRVDQAPRSGAAHPRRRPGAPAGIRALSVGPPGRQDHPTLRHRRAQAESWRVLGLRTCGIVGLTRRRPVGKTVATLESGAGRHAKSAWDAPDRPRRRLAAGRPARYKNRWSTARPGDVPERSPRRPAEPEPPRIPRARARPCHESGGNR